MLLTGGLRDLSTGLLACSHGSCLPQSEGFKAEQGGSHQASSDIQLKAHTFTSFLLCSFEANH